MNNRTKYSMLGALFLVLCLLVVLSWNFRSRSSALVQQRALIGKWQRVGYPGITMTFLTDGRMSVDVTGEHIVSGKYNLVGERLLVLEVDKAPAGVGMVTNVVSLKSGELRVTPANGETERYKRVE